MQIQTNTLSLFSQRKLAENAGSVDRSLQRLSSGLRINSAKDDAARLAITERMTSRVRGANQALRNVSDGASMLQVADGALGTITNALQRARELSVQAANGTLGASDRQNLQQEVSQLVANIDSIAAQTVFNGEQVFDQNRSGVGGDVNRRAVVDGLRLGWLQEAEQRVKKYYGIVGDGQLTMNVNLDTTDGAGNTLASVSTTSVGGNGQWQNITLNVDMADFVPPNLPDGGNAPVYNDRIIAHEMVHAEMSRSMNFNALPSWFKEGMAELIHGADERLVVDYNAGAGWGAIQAAYNADDVSASAGYSAGYAATRYMHDRIKAAGGSGIKDIMVYLNQNPGATLSTAITNASHGAFANLAGFDAAFNANGNAFIASMNLTNADTGAIGGFDADGGAVLSAKDVLLDVGTSYGDNILEGFKLNFPTLPKNANQRWVDLQVGAGAQDKVTVGITAANAGALGISDLDVSTLPQFALVHIDEALNAVSTARANIGAALSRLDATAGNLQTTSENLQASRSRMLDADYAEETASLTRDQILRQSGIAMLSMANTTPNLVLQLLRGA